jgi:MinD superfamily P-loop ATPase
VSKRLCTGCGFCARSCPAGAIAMTDGRPQFSARCEHCSGCVNRCPQKALSFGRARPGGARYVHPEYSGELRGARGEGRDGLPHP